MSSLEVSESMVYLVAMAVGLAVVLFGSIVHLLATKGELHAALKNSVIQAGQINELWERNADDRKLMCELIQRIEELETKFADTSVTLDMQYGDLSQAGWVSIPDICASIDTDFMGAKVGSIDEIL